MIMGAKEKGIKEIDQLWILGFENWGFWCLIKLSREC